MSEDTTNSGKRKQRDEVDSGNIVNDKRQRVQSAKLRENADTLKKPQARKSKDLGAASHPVLIESTDDEDTSVQEMDSESDKSEDEEESLPRLGTPKKTVQAKRRPLANTKSTSTVVSQQKNDESSVAVNDEDDQSKAKVSNCIMLFYKQVPCDANGYAEDGTKYFQCCHPHTNGLSKILKITQAMRGSKTGLRQHLESHGDMFSFYNFLRVVTASRLPTSEEIDIANRTTVLTREELREIVKDLPDANNIVEMFQKQENKKMVPWEHATFKRFLVEWVVKTDQPFTATEDPTFQRLLQYIHRAGNLSIPSSDTVKRNIQDMKTEDFQRTKAMIQGLESKVSLSLDAWTSSNGYAFLAIVIHYITNDWKLDEKLIAFEEISGRHSGDNLGAIVWQVIERYGIKEKLIAITCDNATNNDTMLRYIGGKMHSDNIDFSSSDARMRCMPHTVHLAAMKLLEALGAIDYVDESAGAYQEDINPVDEDEEAIREDGCEEEEDMSNAIISIAKLRKFVRMIRASPQRRQEWVQAATPMLSEKEQERGQIALMLILDVSTRWSSTHYMLCRALRFQKAIDTFCAKREYRNYELDTKDWAAIELVSSWLHHFRRATTAMSATKIPTLSSAYGYFLHLQNSLRKAIQEFPATAPLQLKDALRAAHKKLADYLTRFVASPYYLWATLLDPRISYSGMKRNAIGDARLLQLIDEAKRTLEEHFHSTYVIRYQGDAISSDALMDNTETSVHDIASLFSTDEPSNSNTELEEYFSMKQERSWTDCDPVKWWAGRCAQFPLLSLFARDIHCIPGSSVAVERIFSSGRDTIAFRRSSLRPGTIGDLMMVKHTLKAVNKSI